MLLLKPSSRMGRGLKPLQLPLEREILDQLGDYLRRGKSSGFGGQSPGADRARAAALTSPEPWGVLGWFHCPFPLFSAQTSWCRFLAEFGTKGMATPGSLGLHFASSPPPTITR